MVSITVSCAAKFDLSSGHWIHQHKQHYREKYLSKDSGNRFEKLFPEQTLVSSLTFNVKGELLAFSANSQSLLQIDINTKDKKEYKLPVLEKNDAVSYITQNPKNSNVIALTTFMKDVFLSEDSGSTCTKIADKGKGE